MNSSHHIHEHTYMSNKDELIALIRYMVNHNASHAKELSELAEKLDKEDAGEAFALAKDAISEFESANRKLTLALEVITGR